MSLPLPKKDLLTVIFLLFLLLAIPLTVLLLKESQELRKRAEADRHGQLTIYGNIEGEPEKTTDREVTLGLTTPANPLSYAFLPIVSKAFFGYSSGIVVQNPGEDGVEVTVRLFPQGSGDVIALPPTTIAPADRVGFYLPNFSDVPDNFLGSAMITESRGRTILAEATHNRETAGSAGGTVGSAASYTGQGWQEPASAYYLPVVMKDYYGFSSSIAIQNIGVSPTRARVTIFEDGSRSSPIELTTAEIPSGSMRVFYLPQVPEIPSTPEDPARFVGSAVVESLEGQSLVVAVTEASRPEEGRESGEMLGVYLASRRDTYLSQTRLYLPSVVKDYYGYTTGWRIQNIDDSPTTVRGTAYSLWGEQSFALGEYEIPPNRSVGVYAGNLSGLPGGFIGSAVFESLDGKRIFGRAARSASFQQPYVEEFHDLDGWTRAPNFPRPGFPLPGIVADHFIEAQGRLKLDADKSSTFPTFYQENFFPDGSWRLEYDLTYEDVEGYGDGVVISSQPFPPNYEAELCGGPNIHYLPTPDILQTWQGGTGEIERFRLTFMGENLFFGEPREANVRYDVSLEYNSAEDRYTVGLKRNGIVQEIPDPSRPSGGLSASTILLGNSHNQNESTAGTVCPGASNGSGNWSRMTIDKITLSPSPRGQVTDVALASYSGHHNQLLIGTDARQDKAYLPLVMKNYYGWTSGIMVQNTGNGPTRLELVFRQAETGAEYKVSTAPLDASASYQIYLGNEQLLPDNYAGTLVVKSLDGQPITAVESHVLFYQNDRGETSGAALGSYESLWFTTPQYKVANAADAACSGLDQASWQVSPESGSFTISDWTLIEGLGEKFVCAQFLKSDGRFGAKIHDTIELVADAPPTVSIVSPGGESQTTVENNGTTNSADVTIEFTASDDHTPPEDLEFCYQLDDADVSNCTQFTPLPVDAWVATFSGLSQGDHSFYVWVEDNAEQLGGPAQWNFRVVLVLGIRVDLQPDEEWALLNESKRFTAQAYDTKGTVDPSDDTALSDGEVTYAWELLNPDPSNMNSRLSDTGQVRVKDLEAGTIPGDLDVRVVATLNIDQTLTAADTSKIHVREAISCDLFPAEDFVFTLGEPAKSLNVTLTPPGSGFYTLVWQSRRRQVLAGDFDDGLGGRGNPLTTAANAVNWTPSADAVEGDVFEIAVNATDDKTGSTCNDSVRATISVAAAYGVEIIDPTTEVISLSVGQVRENIKAQAYRVVGGVRENVTADLYVWTEGAPNGGVGEIRYKATRNTDQLIDFVAQRRGEERIYVVARITPPVGAQVTTDRDSLLIKVYDPLSCEGGINPDAATAYLGDEVSFEANPSGGSSAYTIGWSSTFNDAFSPEQAFRSPAGNLVNPLVDGGDKVTWLAPARGGMDLNLLPRTYEIKATVRDSLLANRSCEMTATVTLNKRQANLLLRFRFQARLPGVINDPLTTKFEHNKVRVMALDLVKAEKPVIYDQTHPATSSGPQGQVALVLLIDSLEFGREYPFYLRGPQHVRNQATQKLILRPSVSNYTLDFGTLPVGDFGPIDGKGRNNVINALDFTNWDDEINANLRTVELNQQLDTFGDINLDVILNALDYSFYSHNVKKEIRGVSCPLCPDERRVN